jgi:glucose/arabinose dehydrogenase
LYATIAVAAILGTPLARGDDLPLEKIKLPPGFAIELVARAEVYARVAQLGRLRLGSAHQRTVVYEQRARPAGRRFTSRYIESCAPVGMRFYTGAQFPPAYRNQIFIAEHGSWNRSKKIGCRVTVVRVENNRAVGYEPFATGWLEGETAWGRPADVLVMPDGSLLVSDDLAGAI